MGEVPVDLDSVAEGHLSRGGGEGVAGGQQEGLGVPAAGVILGGELQYFQGGAGGCNKKEVLDETHVCTTRTKIIIKEDSRSNTAFDTQFYFNYDICTTSM